MIASSSHPSELLLLSFVRAIASVKPAEESEWEEGKEERYADGFCVVCLQI
jgi:hypothetical protein